MQDRFFVAVVVRVWSNDRVLCLYFIPPTFFVSSSYVPCSLFPVFLSFFFCRRASFCLFLFINTPFLFFFYNINLAFTFESI